MKDSESLLAHVKKAINPHFQDWVLFSNGTYVIFDSAKSSDDLEQMAISSMKKYGPVQAGGPAGDFGTISLTDTDGWVVSGHGYGMYTYVSPDSVGGIQADDVTVGLFGRSKRDQDSKDLKIIHVNRKPIPE